MDGMRRDGVLLLVDGESILDREGTAAEEGGELTGGSRLGVDMLAGSCLCVREMRSSAGMGWRWERGYLRSSIGRGAISFTCKRAQLV